MIKHRRPSVPFKPKSIEFPPEVGERFSEYLRAYFAEQNPQKQEAIAADAGWLLQQHQSGRVRLPDVLKLFHAMRGELG
jgi:hypothetical protein